MAEAVAVAGLRPESHRLWTRLSHWIMALSFLFLAFSGFVILMAHPRLYWGEVGNALTPALLELPISNNHRPEGWDQAVVFTELPNAPVSANRMYPIFNQNSWARSLHFLAGWFFVLAGAFYASMGATTGHIRKNLLPGAKELAPRSLARELRGYFSGRLKAAGGGLPYGVLQKCTYAAVAFGVLPFMIVSGLTMAPTITAAYPILLDIFGGYQTARTLHFVGFAALLLFFIVHIVMVAATGFRRQLRAMVLGD